MNDNLMIFEGNDVEVFELNGQVLFNPKNVAEILGIADIKSSIRNFTCNQVIKLKNSDVHTMHFRKLNNAGENFLTESGVYKLAFKSRKPEAERFSNWVTDEVLPTIRKHGAYMTSQTIEKALSSPDFLIQLATKLKEEQEARKLAEQIIEDQRPKVEYHDDVLNKDGLITTTVIAKDLGLRSAAKLNKIMNFLGIIFKNKSGTWCPYADYEWLIKENYADYQSYRDENSKPCLKWTEKGRKWIIGHYDDWIRELTE